MELILVKTIEVPEFTGEEEFTDARCEFAIDAICNYAHMARVTLKDGSRLEAEYDLERMVKGTEGHEDINFNLVNWTEILDNLKNVGF